MYVIRLVVYFQYINTYQLCYLSIIQVATTILLVASYPGSFPLTSTRKSLVRGYPASTTHQQVKYILPSHCHCTCSCVLIRLSGANDTIPTYLVTEMNWTDREHVGLLIVKHFNSVLPWIDTHLLCDTCVLNSDADLEVYSIGTILKALQILSVLHVTHLLLWRT